MIIACGKLSDYSFVFFHTIASKKTLVLILMAIRYYVNTFTGISVWEMPTEPAYGPPPTGYNVPAPDAPTGNQQTQFTGSLPDSTALTTQAPSSTDILPEAQSQGERGIISDFFGRKSSGVSQGSGPPGQNYGPPPGQGKGTLVEILGKRYLELVLDFSLQE
jgi:hypothetical protein